MTLIFSLVLKNTGPWNNPMLFFIVLLMTVWSISLWTDSLTKANGSHPYIYVAVITLLIAMVLAASRSTLQQQPKIRMFRYRKPVKLDTLPEQKFSGSAPNLFFWILLVIESLLILTAYFLDYMGITI
jgi:hypothetical protein